MAANLGTAYVRVIGDLSTLNKQLVANFHPARLGKMGKVAGVAIGAGVAAGIAGKAAFDLGSQFDKEFDKIRVGTGRTGKALEGLQGDFKDVLKTVPADFASVGTAITGLNSRLGLTGKPLQRLTRQIVELSRITGTDVQENVESLTRLFGDWSVQSGKQAGKLDELFRTAQKTGIGVSKLARFMVQFGAPLRSLGFDFEEAAALFGRFEREGVNIQTTLPGLRFALKEFAAAGREPKKALQDTIKEIQRLGPGAESTSLAFKTFGKRAGPDMVRAILEGRFALDDLVKQMKTGSDTIEKAGEDTRDFGEQWQLLKNRVFVGLEPIASKFFETIGDGMEALATADFSAIRDNFKSLGEDIGLGDISLDLDLGGGTSEDLDRLKGSVMALGDAFRFTLPIAKEQFAGLVQNMRGGTQIITGLLKTLSAILHGDFSGAFDGLKLIVRGSMNAILGILRAFTAPFRVAAKALGGVLEGPFTAAWDGVKSAFRKGLSAALDLLRLRVTVFRGAARLLGDAVQGGFSRAADLVGAVRGILAKVPGAITGFVGRVANAGVSIGKALARGLTRGIGNLGSAIFDAIKRGLSGRTLIPSFKIDPPGPGSWTFKGIKFPAFAKGGKMKRKGLALVGEEGPELAELPAGTKIHTAQKTKRMIGTGDSRKAPDPPSFALRGVRSSRSGFNPAVSFLVNVMREKFGLSVSPQGGVRPGDSGSFHAVGKAADFVGPKMREAAGWVKSSGLYKTLLEGIHNPNLSTDSGRLVSPGFWGSGTWADHKDHIHLAASNIAAAVKRGLDKKTTRRKRITGKLSLGQIVTLAKQAGFPDPALAAAVAYAESTGRVGATGDGGDSHGLWQINSPAHPNYDAEKLESDARYNAKAALAISRGGKNWQPWTQFRTGAYKRFLGATGKPLPGAGGPSGATSSYADYIALRLEEAETFTPGKDSDDLRWINKGLKYWRKVYRRNKGSNISRAKDALGNIRDLRDKKKALREAAEETAYELTPLGKQIGSGGAIFSIQNLQGVLDSNERKTAFAVLTERLDANGNVTPDSYTDDLGAATELRNLWDYLFGLTTGRQSLPGQGHWQNAPGEQPLDRLGNPTTPAKAKWWRHADGTVSGAPRTIAVAGKPVPIIGTPKQQTYAAQQLKSARDALKSIQDEMKTEDLSVTDTGPSFAEQARSFLAALGDLKKQFGSNFKPIKAFAKGGVLKHRLALVGEEGPEIAQLPIGTRIHSNPDSQRMAKRLGIQAFAQGGVIQPSQHVSQVSTPDPELAAALKRIEALLKAQRPVTNVQQDLHFTQAPEDQHAVQKSALFELEAEV